ncbi:MAG TPA: sodium/solute symporter [Oceanipulchritudo sp.]|nr:sodium/solute symporter [Oceanipulchritudo sp.]
MLLYGLGILGLSVSISRRQKSTREYFIAGRSMPGWAVAMTLMAVLIGSGTVVGHPATVYQAGMILLLGNLTLPLVLLFVARYIVPFYRNTVGMSAYEYIGQRFGLGGRFYASFGFLADRLFDLGITLLTTAIALNVMTGWSLPAVIFWSSMFTVVYTMIGGITAVVWTSVVQGVIFVAASLLIVGRLLFAPEVEGFGGVVVEAWKAGKFSLGNFDLSPKALTNPFVTSQWLFILAYTVNWGRRYISDQHMVQRYLIARSDREASRGAIWNALLCVPIYLIFMFIGACLFGFYSLTDNPPPTLADNVVPHFIVHAMPAGVVGLILAAILSASMSSVSGDLNSIATVLTRDYLNYLRPEANDRFQLIFGRCMVFLAGIVTTLIAILLIPEQGLASVMERGVTIAAILSGGMLGLFFLGFLTRRATRQGCYIGIVSCILFTAWALLTEPKTRTLDLPLNFDLNPILIGVFSHVILFGVGYLASLIFGGYRPDNVERLTIRHKFTGKEQGA